MYRPKPQRIIFGGKSHLDLVGEILRVGKNQYSDMDCVIVGLTNGQAIDYLAAGFLVRCSAKGSNFLGRVNTEHVLYLTIDIPRTFDMDKIRLWRLQTNLFDRSRKATIEFTAQYWAFEDGEKDGYKLTLTEIYEVDEDEDDELDATRTILKERNRQRDLYATGGPLGSLPTMLDGSGRDSRFRMDIFAEKGRYNRYFEEELVAGRTPLTQREFNQRNNRRRTVWALGDTVTLNGIEYVVGNVSEFGDSWGIRIDRKYTPSAFLRVPK